jgi:hypothetical protein
MPTYSASWPRGWGCSGNTSRPASRSDGARARPAAARYWRRPAQRRVTDTAVRLRADSVRGCVRRRRTESAPLPEDLEASAPMASTDSSRTATEPSAHSDPPASDRTISRRWVSCCARREGDAPDDANARAGGRSVRFSTSLARHCTLHVSRRPANGEPAERLQVPQHAQQLHRAASHTR